MVSKFFCSTEKILIESVNVQDTIPIFEYTYGYGYNFRCGIINRPGLKQLKYYNLIVNNNVLFNFIDESELRYFKLGSEITAVNILGCWLTPTPQCFSAQFFEFLFESQIKSFLDVRFIILNILFP